MGLFSWLFSGRDLYVNYEKSFERIIEKSNAILARRHARRKKMESYSRALWHAFCASIGASIGHLIWLNRLPAGALSWQQHLTRSALSIVIPFATFILYIAFGKVVSIFEARDSRTLKRLNDSKKKMVQDLKDSTRFEKTMALIRKYSPEDQVNIAPPPHQAALLNTPSAKQQVQTSRPVATPPSQLLSAAAGAGKALFPMFDSLATGLMGDNPQLVAHLRQTQAQLLAEQQRNAALVQQIKELQAKYSISTDDMSATRHLSAPPEASSPPKQLADDVALEEDESASPSFLTGPFIQPKQLTYSGVDKSTPESRLQQSSGTLRGELGGGGPADGEGSRVQGEAPGPAPGGGGDLRGGGSRAAGSKGSDNAAHAAGGNSNNDDAAARTAARRSVRGVSNGRADTVAASAATHTSGGTAAERRKVAK